MTTSPSRDPAPHSPRALQQPLPAWPRRCASLLAAGACRTVCFLPALLLGFWTGLHGMPAAAANFEIAPVIIELAAGHAADSVRITNRDQRPMSIQVRAYDWSQVDGEDQLDPAVQLQLSPPLFTLAPGASQTVRLLARPPAAAMAASALAASVAPASASAAVPASGRDTERAWRLLIDQIPAPEDGLAINFKFRVSMPVFFAPAGKAEAALSWRLISGADRGVDGANGSAGAAVEVRNAGNRRVRINNLSVLLPDGASVTPVMGAHPYVLAGGLRRFPLPAGVTPAGPVQLIYSPDASTQTLRVDVRAP